ncbi:hypothetical protein BX661DRAFT_199483 [Kickxella alabastrina]|uniref:uncharacterized protein n=1 Tax=Kickxella alabastrina TaxID=61397 RepID=UPI00221EEB77|nr:uncharacterized protein BX661DRAFT_199483 [Kickxella alabastrina]KAI7824955.1 hypothetical protein BX661DRAFT_199483 [Kickxella alabastrina]
MSLGDKSQRDLDKIGGIIATVIFGLCLILHLWRWARYRCHPLAATSLFLVLRTIGWLLVFIGALRNDTLLNKRGHIVNALAFWLLMLGSLLLLVRWDASRRGVRYTNISWGATGLASLGCAVMGALEAAGQITWLNNPGDKPTVILKVAEVGFVVLSGCNALVSLFFNFREGPMYQKPVVRCAFVFSSLSILVRCLFWMLVALQTILFTETNRQIFLYCLGTVLEIVAVVLWGLLPATKHLKPHSGASFVETPSVKLDDSSIKPLTGEPGKPLHKLSENDLRNLPVEYYEEPETSHANNADISQFGTTQAGAFGSYSSTYQGTHQSMVPGSSSAYSSYGHQQMQQQAQAQQQAQPASTFVTNPWSGSTSSLVPPGTLYDPRQQPFIAPPQAMGQQQPVMITGQPVGFMSFPTQIQQIPQQPMREQHHMSMPYVPVVSAVPHQSVSFVAPTMNGQFAQSSQYPVYVRTPAPTLLGGNQTRGPQTDGSAQESESDYFAGRDYVNVDTSQSHTQQQHNSYN